MQPTYRGKVRDIYDLGDKLLMVSSDRISAFDVVFDQTLDKKGIALNQVSRLWFEYFRDIPNHVISTDTKDFPEFFQKDSYFAERSILVKKCKRIDFECVVRGYLSGSGYKEYKDSNTLAKKKLRLGMLESEKLDEPLFTPAIKNDTGHDENISEDEMLDKLGKDMFDSIKSTSIKLYTRAADLLYKRGFILCDTKFEFGILDNQIILIDEILTPDSSRYWETSTYKTGISPPSYDKQILRNYLETLDWNKKPPAPRIPEEVLAKLQQKYNQMMEVIKSCISEK